MEHSSSHCHTDCLPNAPKRRESLVIDPEVLTLFTADEQTQSQKELDNSCRWSDSMPIRPCRRTSYHLINDNNHDNDDFLQSATEKRSQSDGCITAFSVDPLLPSDALPAMPTRRHSYGEATAVIPSLELLDLTVFVNSSSDGKAGSSSGGDLADNDEGESEPTCTAQNPASASEQLPSILPPSSFKGMEVPQRRRYQSEPAVACIEDKTTGKTKCSAANCEQQRRSRRSLLRKYKSKSLSDIRTYKIKLRSDRVNKCYGSPDILDRKRKCNSPRSDSLSKSSLQKKGTMCRRNSNASWTSDLHTINEREDGLEASMSRF